MAGGGFENKPVTEDGDGAADVDAVFALDPIVFDCLAGRHSSLAAVS